MKKIIGISPRYWSNETQEYIRVGRQYTNQLQNENIIPIILVDSPNLEDELNLCDAFLVIGGDDINPEYYGQKNEGFSRDVHETCDKVDLQIIKHAEKFKKPILGICRGIQALSAFMGGTLHQDLQNENISHPLLEEHKHMVTKKENFGVAALLPDTFLVNSFHHQAVNNPPKGFHVLFMNDQTVEAIEHETLPFIAVQWHPERFYTKESEIIFNYFLGKIK